MEAFGNDFGKDDEAIFECIERHFPNPQYRKKSME
jgi:hypothetical protein